MFIQTEATPNPEVLKFLPGREVMGEGARDFRDAGEAAASPLAAEIFAVEGVRRLYYGPDFLTVEKAADIDWAVLKAPILAAIMDHFTAGAPLFAAEGDAAAAGHNDEEYEGETAQIVAEITFDLSEPASARMRSISSRTSFVWPPTSLLRSFAVMPAVKTKPFASTALERMPADSCLTMAMVTGFLTLNVDDGGTVLARQCAGASPVSAQNTLVP